RVEAGYVAESILHKLEQGEHDLVVMGTHGRTGIRHVLLGSVAERIVRLASCPVLTVRMPREAEEHAAREREQVKSERSEELRRRVARGADRPLAKARSAKGRRPFKGARKETPAEPSKEPPKPGR